MIIKKNSTLYLDDNAVADWDDMKKSYACRHEQFGYSPKALFYSDDKLHKDRLNQVSDILATHVLPEDSILDVGCGFGGLVPHLPACSYQGIDIIDHFVEEARRRHPNACFDVNNVLDMETAYDWVLMVGILGTLPKPEEVLAKSMHLARKGMVVDFLDASKYSGSYNQYDIGACTNFFIEHQAKQVSVYATNDHPWTFVVAQKQHFATLGKSRNDP